MNTTSWILGVVAVLIIGLGAWWYTSRQAPTAPAQLAASGTDANMPDDGVLTEPKTVTVLYGSDGFSPSTMTVKQGDTVTFVNNKGGSMWVASAPHPGHAGYDGTDRATHCAAGYAGATPFDQCAAGVTYSFTFNKAGMWKYHNHDNSSNFGAVIVQ